MGNVSIKLGKPVRRTRAEMDARLREMAASPSPKDRALAASHPSATPEFLIEVASIDDPLWADFQPIPEEMRRAIRNPNFPVEVLTAIIQGTNRRHMDPPTTLIADALGNKNVPTEVLDDFDYRAGHGGLGDVPASLALMVLRHPNCPERVFASRVGSWSNGMENQVAMADNPNLPERWQKYLAQNAKPRVAQGLARNPNLCLAASRNLLRDGTTFTKESLASHSKHPSILSALAQDESRSVRRRALKNKNTPEVDRVMVALRD